jgi:hypothetical protein
MADMHRTIRVWKRTGHKRSFEILAHIYFIFNIIGSTRKFIKNTSTSYIRNEGIRPKTLKINFNVLKKYFHAHKKEIKISLPEGISSHLFG